MNFEMSLAYLDPAIPRVSISRSTTAAELAEHFVMWEYATRRHVRLPHDACARSTSPTSLRPRPPVLGILREGQPAPDFAAGLTSDGVHTGEAEVAAVPLPVRRRVTDLRGALRATASADVQAPATTSPVNAFLAVHG